VGHAEEGRDEGDADQKVVGHRAGWLDVWCVQQDLGCEYQNASGIRMPVSSHVPLAMRYAGQVARRGGQCPTAAARRASPGGGLQDL
jgi:hypothetical protein